jgi:signal transduction histidine kinase
VGGSPSFVFTDLYLGIRMRDLTEDQLARRYFIMNFSLSAIAAVVLLGGIAFALRTASRAMKFSQMKTDFVSNVSHELRTPLASIRVFGEFLKLGRVNDGTKIQEYGAYIENESRRLTQLINNILDFSKIESGQKTYQFERRDLARIVSDTLSLASVQLEAQGFTVRLNKPDDPLPEVLLDAEAFGQALMNLLDNAVKYSGGSREIVVKIGTEPDYVTVSVSDRGIGIARDEVEKIFEKFYRVSTGLVHDVKGSGLGLSIVKHVIEAHEGRVTVASAPGEGSTFTIHLPRAPGTPNEQPGVDTVDSDQIVPGDAVGHGLRA